MEAFNKMIEHAIVGGFLSDCKVVVRGGQGESFIFADGTLVFC